MADRRGNRFFWGLVIGGALGYLLARYLGTEDGQRQLDALKAKTVELTAENSELRQRAASAAITVRDAVQGAIQEGMTAAKERRQQLTQSAAQLVSGATNGTGEGT